ncbi:MAG: FkbM family methyltransferase [Candidatus Liptonbacteria bacterium]|nr:FkbM family methyltransferase [Candidatus Liptonbacteria bacterium]
MISSKILGALYRLEFVKRIKNWVRPIKHRLLGKSGIYRAIEEAERLAGGAGKIHTVFDVGAATGEYALHFLSAFPNAIIYCFEPFPDSFAQLVKRTAPYARRVRLFPHGLHNHEGQLAFYVSPNPDGSSFLDKKIGFKKKMIVQIRCLDDVVREQRISSIDFLKIDVEGTEYEVLTGGSQAIKEKVVSAFVEIQPQFKGFHSRDHFAIFEKLADAGFGWGVLP